MATIIPARKPIYNEQYKTNMNWWCTIEYPVSANLYNYSRLLVIKRSPSISTATQLRLNVSPLAKDYFRHTPELTIPVHIIASTTNKPVRVSLAATYYDTGKFATFDAYDGWETYLSNVIGVSNMNVTKKLFRDSPAYISGKPFSCNNIRWLLNDGTDVVVSNNFASTETNTIFPVINSLLTITDAHTGLSVIGRDNLNNELWRLEYEFVCPYDEANTIGFVNKYGVWEFIDLDGRKKTKLNTERKEYTRYSDGSMQSFDVSGSYEYEFNTGWVDKGFEDVIEGLMLSENVVIYKGDGSDPIEIIIDVKTLDIQDSRADKMVNYNFKAKVAKPIIPIT